MQNVIDFFNAGGPMMYPLALLAFIILIMFSERLLYLHKGQIRAVEFVAGIKESLKKRRLLEAITICDESYGPVPCVVKEALINSEASSDVLSQAVNTAAVNQFALLSRRISSLAMLAKVAPLLGLMGTVLGFLSIFSAMGESASFVSVAELSTGIYNALISSAFGLFVAVVGWLAYSFLNSKLKALAQDIDWASNEIMLFIVRKMPEREDLYIEGGDKK